MSEINIDEAQKLIKDAKFEDDEYKTTENVKSYYRLVFYILMIKYKNIIVIKRNFFFLQHCSQCN